MKSTSVGRRFSRSTHNEDLLSPVPPGAVIIFNPWTTAFRSSSMPTAAATARASSSARKAVALSSGTESTSTDVKSVAPEAALMATLPRSFFQMSRVTSSDTWVSRPASVKSRAMFAALSLLPPPISPICEGTRLKSRI